LADTIREMSDGRLDMETFAGGELVEAPEIADALGSNLIQFSLTNAGYYTGAIPEMMLSPDGWPPNVVRSLDDRIELFWQRGLNEIIREALVPHGMHFLMPTPPVPIRFWSKEPMYGIDEMQGFKMRLWGKFVDAFNEAGASAVYLPHPEVYPAIATGVLDGGGGLATFYESMNFYELCDYYYDVPIVGGGLIIVASLDAWNELPDDLKAIVNEASMSYRMKNYGHINHSFFEMRTKFAGWGTTVITWPAEDLNPISEASFKILDEIEAASATNAEGMAIVKQFMRDMGYVE